MSVLVDFIKEQLAGNKIRKDLQEVVENVDALIPQKESILFNSRSRG